MLPQGDAKPHATRSVQAHTPCLEPNLLPGLWKPPQHPGGTQAPALGSQQGLPSALEQQGSGIPCTSTPGVWSRLPLACHAAPCLRARSGAGLGGWSPPSWQQCRMPAAEQCQG